MRAILLGLVALTLLWIYVFPHIKPANVLSLIQLDNRSAIAICKQGVEKRLDQPMSLEYVAVSAAQRLSRERRYVVTGYIYAEYQSGKVIKYVFECETAATPDGWETNSVHLGEVKGRELQASEL